MPLSPDIAPEILQVCQTNAQEASDALSRALDSKLQLAVGSPETTSTANAPSDWNGPGLIIVLNVETEAAVVVLSEASGLLPNWYRAPDPTGKSKLTTLAQELGMLFLPDALMPMDFSAGYVPNLRAALENGGLAATAGCVPLTISAGDKQGTLRVVWPISKPSQVLKQSEVKSEAVTPSVKETAGGDKKGAELSEDDLEAAFANLPPYVRSLLKIRVAVAVRLATTKMPVEHIIDIGPGTIIQFKRNCEQPLTLCVGDHVVADGEAVKVGDKFGLRITSMILPGERFYPLLGKQGIRRAS